jgi:hypothetical protein
VSTATVIEFPVRRPETSVAPAEPGTSDPEPGTLRKLTAARLADSGIAVRKRRGDLIIQPVGKPRSMKRARATGAALWTLDVDDDTSVHLSIRPWARHTSNPLWIAGIAAALLTGVSEPLEPHPAAPSARVLGIKGAAGMHLRHHGFPVELNVCADNRTLELTADVSATTADYDTDEAADPGIVFISDDGTVYYEHTFGQSTARLTAGDPAAPLPGPSAVARDIAATVTAALNAARLQRAEG